MSHGKDLFSEVSRAFKNSTLAFALEKKYGRKALTECIPWMREQALCTPKIIPILSWFREKPPTPRIVAMRELALAYWLPLSPVLENLGESSDVVGQKYNSLYSVFSRPKKNGGKREVSSPREALVSAHRSIRDNVLKDIPLHDAAHAYRKGRSIYTNAAQHYGKQIVATLDIENFYPSISREMVDRAFRLNLGGVLSEDALNFLTDLCVYNSHLPTGSPLSPALSNIVLKEMDEKIYQLSLQNDVSYTRYADDLAFSGSERVQSILIEVVHILTQFGFKLNQSKTRVMPANQRQVITGLVVNTAPSVPRTERKQLRAAVHAYTQGESVTWDGKKIGRNHLMGKISFLAHTRPEEAADLKEQIRTSEEE